jgi:hypothetical protein
MKNKELLDDIEKAQFVKEQQFHQRTFLQDLSWLPQDGVIYHQNRAKKCAKSVEDLITGRFLCHIGCHTGVVTQQFSKNCSKILALDIEEHHRKETLARQHNCPVDVKKMDAIKYLQENIDVNPEVFYMWMNYRAMQPWIDKVMDVRGHTNPTIILGIGLQKVVSPVKKGKSLQLEEAKKLKQKYSGSIRLFSFSTSEAKGKRGAFGVLILKGLK